MVRTEGLEVGEGERGAVCLLLKWAAPGYGLRTPGRRPAPLERNFVFSLLLRNDISNVIPQVVLVVPGNF